MSGPPKVLLPGGGATLLGVADSLGALVAPMLRPPVKITYLSSRRLAFQVHSIGARPNVESAVHVFAHRYGAGWRVLYVGRRADHMITKAMGYGATHLLVRSTPAHAL